MVMRVDRSIMGNPPGSIQCRLAARCPFLTAGTILSGTTYRSKTVETVYGTQRLLSAVRAALAREMRGNYDTSCTK